MYLPDAVILLLWILNHMIEQYCLYSFSELEKTVSAMWSCYWGAEGGAMSVKVMQKGSHRGTITLGYGLLNTKLYNTFNKDFLHWALYLGKHVEQKLAWSLICRA